MVDSSSSFVWAVYRANIRLWFTCLPIPETDWGTEDDKSHLLSIDLTITFDGRLIIIVCVSAAYRANIHLWFTCLPIPETDWEIGMRFGDFSTLNSTINSDSGPHRENFFTIISDTGRTFGIWNIGNLYNKFQLWTTLRTLPQYFPTLEFTRECAIWVVLLRSGLRFGFSLRL